MKGTLLRPATPADAPALSVLASQVFVDTYVVDGISVKFAREVTQAFGRQPVERLLADKETCIVVAEQNGHLQGFVQWTRGRFPSLRDQPSAELQRLYVLRAFAGRGLGSRLLLRCEDDAAAAGATQLWLTAWSDNAHALNFYARKNYSDAGATHYTFEDESWENRVLLKQLPGAS